MRKFTARIIAFIAIAACVWAVAYYGFLRQDKQQYNFKTAKIEKKDIIQSIDATGTVEPEELVDVGAFPRAAPAKPEGFFAQAAQFQHHVRGVVGGDHIDQPIPEVGVPEELFLGEFVFYFFPFYGRDDFLHGFQFCVKSASGLPASL